MKQQYNENNRIQNSYTEQIFYLSEGNIQELEIEMPPKIEPSQLEKITVAVKKE